MLEVGLEDGNNNELKLYLMLLRPATNMSRIHSKSILLMLIFHQVGHCVGSQKYS